MPKSESDYKTALCKKLRTQGWYARRIEDQYAVGIPDILLGVPDYLSPLQQGLMVEAKLVRNASFGPTDRQYIELKRWQAPPSRLSVILGFKEDFIYLHPLAPSVKISDCLASEPGEHPSETFRRYLEWQTSEI